MRFRGALVFFFVACLLGSFYLFYQRPAMQARLAAAAFEKRFFRAETGDITFIRIENKDGAVEISHSPRGWYIEQPSRYRPDEGMIRKVLETISSGQLIKVVGSTAELSSFGFDRPVLSLTLGLGERREVLLIGRKNPAETAYYAYAAGLGKIFLVNESLPRELYLRLFDLREKRVYGNLQPAQLGRIVLKRHRETVDLAYADGGWLIRAPFAGRAGEEEMRRFLDDLAQRKAEAFISWNEKLGVGKPKLELQLFDRENRLVTASTAYFLGKGENEGIVVHQPGSGEAARVGRDFWELLQVDVTDLQESRLFPCDPVAVTHISVIAGREQFRLERRGRRWLKNGALTAADQAEMLVQAFCNWKRTQVLTGRKGLGKVRAEIELAEGSRIWRLQVGEEEIKKEVAGQLPILSTDPTDPNKAKVGYVPALVTGMDAPVLIGSHEVENFLRQVRQLR